MNGNFQEVLSQKSRRRSGLTRFGVAFIPEFDRFDAATPQRRRGFGLVLDQQRKEERAYAIVQFPGQKRSSHLPEMLFDEHVVFTAGLAYGGIAKPPDKHVAERRHSPADAG